MENQSLLEADEKAIAQRYQLNHYFKENNNFLLFVAEMRSLLAKRFNGFDRADWAQSKCAELVQEFLQYNESLYSYVNDTFATKNDFKNIPSQDWKFVCKVSSKIIAHGGWNYDSKK